MAAPRDSPAPAAMMVLLALALASAQLAAARGGGGGNGGSTGSGNDPLRIGTVECPPDVVTYRGGGLVTFTQGYTYKLGDGIYTIDGGCAGSGNGGGSNGGGGTGGGGGNGRAAPTSRAAAALGGASRFGAPDSPLNPEDPSLQWGPSGGGPGGRRAPAVVAAAAPAAAVIPQAANLSKTLCCFGAGAGATIIKTQDECIPNIGLLALDGELYGFSGVEIGSGVQGKGSFPMVFANGAKAAFDGVTFSRQNPDPRYWAATILASSGSSLEFYGSTIFRAGVGNGARVGVIRSTAAFRGPATFEDGVAAQSAVYAEQASVDFFGPVLLRNNSGDPVPGMFVATGSAANFWGPASFANNTCSTLGGAAVSAAYGGRVTFHGAASFTGNAAFGTGGAIQVTESTSVMTFNGPACFSQNRAGNAVDEIPVGAGGAILVAGGARVVFAGHKQQFGGNTGKNGAPDAITITTAFPDEATGATGGSIVCPGKHGRTLTRSATGVYNIQGEVCGHKCTGTTCTCPRRQTFSAAACACKFPFKG